MWGLTIVAAWFVGLIAFAVVEAKHGDSNAVGKISIFIMVITAFGVLLVADWIVFPVALAGIALTLVPVANETQREREAQNEQYDLETEREARRAEIAQAKEDRDLGLITEEEYAVQVEQITRPVSRD